MSDELTSSKTNPNVQFQVIYHYFLWNSRVEDDWRIEAVFGREFCKEFTRCDCFGGSSDFGATVYRLEHQIPIPKDRFSDASAHRESYRIRMTLRTARNPDQCCDTEEIFINPSIQHKFFFGFNFSNPTFSSTAKNSSVPFWSQLCFYTYFLIKQNREIEFHSFIEQFLKTYSDQNRTLNREDLGRFYFICSSYFPTIMKNFDTNPIKTLAMFLQMFGMLRINGKNMLVDDNNLRGLLAEIYDYLRAHWFSIVRNTDAKGFKSIEQGFILLLTIPLLMTVETVFDTFFLLNQFDDDPNQQNKIAGQLLRKLVDLQMPIKNSKWTKIIRMTNDSTLLVDLLDFSPNLDDYLVILDLLIQINDSSRILNGVVEHLEKFISQPKIILTLNQIQRFFHMLQSDKKQTIRDIVKRSQQLNQKIKEVFLKLDLNVVPLEVFRELFQLDHSLKLLDTFDKTQFLIQVLNKSTNRSLDFYSSWFIYFICDRNFRSTNEDDQKHFKSLLKVFLEQITRDQENFKKFIRKLNECLKHLSNVIQNDDDHRFIEFTNEIIAIFFKMKIYEIIVELSLHVDHEDFLRHFAEKFVQNIINKNKERLKMMKDEKNPLIRLSECLRYVDSTTDGLLRHLINACTVEIKLAMEEIRRDFFRNPYENSCTYKMLFDEHLNNSRVTQEILDKLNMLWNSWIDIGVTSNDLSTWQNHTAEERRVFKTIWSNLRQLLHKPEPLEVIFERANKDFNDQQEIILSISSSLDLYCGQASDTSQNVTILRQMDQALMMTPIRKVDVPEQLKSMVEICKTLYSFAESKSWKEFYKNSYSDLKHGLENDGQIHSSWTNSDSFQCSSKSSSSRKTSNTKETVLLTSIDCLEEVKKIFETFTKVLFQIYDTWESQSIQPWVTLFDQIDDSKHEIDIFERYLDKKTPKALLDILFLWNNLDRIQHICKGCLNLAQQLNIEIPGEDEETLVQLIKLDKNIAGEDCSNIYQAYERTFASKYSADTLTIWSQYSIASDLIEFIRIRSIQDFDYLLETVTDWDNQLVSAKTVLDFANIKHYLTEVYQLIDESTWKFHDVLSCFNKVKLPPLSDKLENFFSICSTELVNMKESHEYLTDKSKSTRRLMKSILEQSTIQFFQYENDKSRFDVQIEPQRLNFLDLNTLRDRARLMQYSLSRTNKTKEESIEYLQLFIDLIRTIELILNPLKELYITGYSIINRSGILKNSFQCQNTRFDELKNALEMLETNLSTWRECLDENYRLYPELTLFSRNQFEIIKMFLSEPHQHLEQDPGYHLLKYFDMDPFMVIKKEVVIPDQDEERLEYLGRLLFPRQPPLKIDSSNRRIFLVSLVDNDLLGAILTLNRKFKCKPRARNLFFCTSKLDWIDIRAFIYRAFFSNECHLLIRPEKLTISSQDQLASLIRHLLKEDFQRQFRLGVIFDPGETKRLRFIEDLKPLQIIETLPNQEFLKADDLKKEIVETFKNVMLVTATTPSLGKSATIEEECRRRRLERLKFPISGTINPDAIAQRLLNQAGRFRKAAIHLDIGLINNPEEFMDLISVLLYFRCYRFDQVAIFIPLETLIYIELESSSHSVIKKDCSIFSYLKTIDYNRIEPERFLIVESVLFVVNYLQAIKSKSIIEKQINKAMLNPKKHDECIRLIKESFFHDRSFEQLTWTQVFICISIYEYLFECFSKSGHFLPLVLEGKHKKIRLDVLQALLKSATMFTSACSNGNHNNQIIRWDQTQPFTLVFTYSRDPIFVYKTQADIPEALKAYLNQLQTSLTCRRPSNCNGSIDDEEDVHNERTLPDYSKLNHQQLFQKLTLLSSKFLCRSVCTTCFRAYEWTAIKCSKCTGTETTLEKPAKETQSSVDNAFHRRMARIIQKEYIFTPDNFIKMLLVYLRVQCKVPVLIMGETGCGKTALIRCLCEKILDHELYIFRLHAGVTEQSIINKMYELIDFAKSLPKERQMWIFFDEFNTISNISLLKEIICERTLLGMALPDNMVFLGTCNPPRKRENHSSNKNTIGIKKQEFDLVHMARREQKYLYEVRMIPETMLEYVWDYGHLDSETEKTYVEAALKRFPEYVHNRDWFQVIADLISKSQGFVRLLEDVSSVSLRDIARYCRLYLWFQQYIADHCSASDRIERASLLALVLCYYYRLNTIHKKKDYFKCLENGLAAGFPRIRRFPDGSIGKLIDEEEAHLLRLMDIPVDMASNRALKDNLFVLFCCTINRIPVFLCGKPGASKSSAVQILLNNLRGSRSKQACFRRYPELVSVNFQGSTNCTSKSIEQVFERAKKFQDAQTASSNLLPVIIFDEIGLAELSEHNPLKVLHEQLEIETCQFGFIGISNWQLDAAKMNRALYVACVDPDIEELRSTGEHLFKMLYKSDDQSPLNTNTLEGLAHSYVAVQAKLQSQYQRKNYYGLRDFYSLIKGIIYNLQSDPTCDLGKAIYHQLAINFGDDQQMNNFMWETYCRLTDHRRPIGGYPLINPKQLIDQSLENRRGRYLMIIVDAENTIHHLEHYIFQQQQGLVKTLVGSRFEDDFNGKNIYSDAYSSRIVMDIILHAETPMLLIMRQMNHLYDSLYDLFNQVSAHTSEKKYCRIALSATYNPRCVIDDRFFCVVLLCKNEIELSDPPFLNRFQKHFIRMEDLMEPRQRKIASIIIPRRLEKLQLCRKNRDFPQLKHLIIPLSENYVQDLTIQCYDEQLDDEMIVNNCVDKLIQACSFDFPLVLALAKNHQLIKKYYDIHSQFINLSALISSTLEQSLMTRRIIYTFTPTSAPIDYISENKICERKLNVMRTELDLIHFLTESTKSLSKGSIIVIHVDYHNENQYIRSLKSNIYNHLTQFVEFHIFLIFHIQRQRLVDINEMIIFPHWDAFMIDDLNHQSEQIISQECLFSSTYRDFFRQYPVDFLDKFYDEFIHRALVKVQYQGDANGRQDFLRDRLIHHENLRNICQTNIRNFIEQYSHPCLKDWRSDLINNVSITASCRSFDDALKTAIMLFYDQYFRLFINHWEENNLFDSYFHFENQPTKDLWFQSYENSLSTIDLSTFDRSLIEITYVPKLNLPMIVKEFRKFIQLSEKFAEKTDEDFLEFLKENSVFGKTVINSMINDSTLFDLYYDNLLVLFYRTREFKFSYSFLKLLVTSNPQRDNLARLIQLFAQTDEFVEILNIFHHSLNILDEGKLTDYLSQQMTETPTVNVIYSLINGKLKASYSSPINQEFEFYDLADPFLEVSLMNIIELLLSPEEIIRQNQFDEIISLFNVIHICVRRLTNYKILNLGKLVSMIHLLRCIQNSSDSKAMETFHQRSRNVFNFETCDDIHRYLIDLKKYPTMKDKESIFSKLELQFLQQWSIEHPDQSLVTLDFIQQTENQFWKYSTDAIVTVIDKYELGYDLKSADERPDDNSEILARKLKSLAKTDFKIHRIFANRILMDTLAADPLTDESIVEPLKNLFQHFERCIETVPTLEFNSDENLFQHIQLIRLMTFLKYFCQCYAFGLVKKIRITNSENINRLLTNNTSPICQTLKLYLLKEILYRIDSKPNVIGKIPIFRYITWLPRFLQYIKDTKPIDHRSIILPHSVDIPESEFKRVYEIFHYGDESKLKDLITQCGQNLFVAYAFHLVFIGYYSQHSWGNLRNADRYKALFQNDHPLSIAMNASFSSLSIRFLRNLNSNFDKNSYFHLQNTTTADELCTRLVALNIFAVGLCYPLFNWFKSILFNDDSTVPDNYYQHLQKRCLFGFLNTDGSLIENMKKVRAETSSSIFPLGKFIYQCSSNCFYMYTSANEARHCPYCSKSIERNQTKIKRSIPDGLKFIDEYMKNYEQSRRLGYYRVHEANQSSAEEKSDHLLRTRSFRFLHLSMHSVLAILLELKYLTVQDLQRWQIPSPYYFGEHIETDYHLIQGRYTSLFSLCNQLFRDCVELFSPLDNFKKVIDLEKYIEKKLIISSSQTINTDIERYENEYNHLSETDSSLIHYINENIENSDFFPWLEFFNVTPKSLINCLDDFTQCFRELPDFQLMYPLTYYVLENLNELSNIQQLNRLMKLANYARENFTYQITREAAVSTFIHQRLLEEKEKKMLDDFFEAWSQINLSEVRSNCQFRRFDRNISRDQSIAFFSLQNFRDESGLLLRATIQTLSHAQSRLIDHFQRVTHQKHEAKLVSLDRISSNDIFVCNRATLSEKILGHASVMNFVYGQSRTIIYDYEEIEMILQSIVIRLPRINTEEIPEIHYQFEMYAKNISLINHVRQHVEQKIFNQDQTRHYRQQLNDIHEDHLMQYLGTLDSIFAAIKNRHYRSSVSTIQSFVKEYMPSETFHKSNLLKSAFANLPLCVILNFYELIEEILFDRRFRKAINDKFQDDTITDEDRSHIQDLFFQSISQDSTLATELKNPSVWLNTLKRFLVRISSDYIDLECPIEIYLKRTDLWSSQFRPEEIESIKLDERVKVKHTLILVFALENMMQERQLARDSLEEQHVPDKLPTKTLGKSNRPPPRRRI